MKNFFTKFSLSATAILLSASLSAQAQSSSDSAFKPHGQLWGYAFGDFAFKGHSDTVGGGRGGSNQYTKVAQNQSMFQLRRVYLGYNYDISPKFSAEFLFAAEDNATTSAGGYAVATSGDLLTDNKFTAYIKLCNLRWKQIYPGADLVFGQVATPAFPLLSEVVWGYRSIERTVSDIRRTPSFDLGVTLQGRFIPSSDKYGYNVMVGNGQSAKPENDAFKWFYGDVYGKFLNKHLIVDLYQDYERLNWTPTWHHDRNMTKLYIAYTVPKLTVGFEAFTNTLMGDVNAVGSDKKTYHFNTVATDISFYVRGRLYKDKWGFFARYDSYNPSKNIGQFDDGKTFTSYSVNTSQYDPGTKENFMTLGLDYTPVKNVHIMPNIWYNTYANAALASTSKPDGNDMVYRLTFYYIYGK